MNPDEPSESSEEIAASAPEPGMGRRRMGFADFPLASHWFPGATLHIGNQTSLTSQEENHGRFLQAQFMVSLSFLSAVLNYSGQFQLTRATGAQRAALTECGECFLGCGGSGSGQATPTLLKWTSPTVLRVLIGKCTRLCGKSGKDMGFLLVACIVDGLRRSTKLEEKKRNLFSVCSLSHLFKHLVGEASPRFLVRLRWCMCRCSPLAVFGPRVSTHSLPPGFSWGRQLQ